MNGKGQPKFIGDVGIIDGKIAKISNRNGTDRILESANVILDCSGRLICPGWVDIHTHLDGAVCWDPLITPLSGCGVTTAIQGNCGVGFAPCRKQDRNFILGMMEGVEDIPLGAMDAGINFEWETFPEYLESLRRKQFAIDIGAMVAHGPIRAFVLGANRSFQSNRNSGYELSNDEIEQIASTVGGAIKAGAMGFSTSRTLAHRHRDGMLVSGTLALERELIAIGKAIAQSGKGKAVFEMASDFQCIDDVAYTPENHAERLAHFGREFIWMKTICKLGVPMSFVSFSMTLYVVSSRLTHITQYRSASVCLQLPKIWRMASVQC
jgi:N-acyl-D-amino-acid deacylase